MSASRNADGARVALNDPAAVALNNTHTHPARTDRNTVMSRFTVTMRDADTGVEFGTVTVEAADEWKARTAAHAARTFGIRNGCGIDYTVTAQ